MNVAFDSQIFCAQNYGGVSRYFCEIATRIAKNADIHISITAPMHINGYLTEVPSKIVLGFRSPNTNRFQKSSGVNYPKLVARGLGLLIGDLMLRIIRPDIVHETYYSPYRLGSSRALRVLTIYDMIHEKFPTNFPHADKTARYKAMAAQRADHIICISESTRQDVIEILGLDPDKISVIYLGCDLMNVDAEIVRKVQLPTAEPFLLYVGNRNGYKNFPIFLEAYSSSDFIKSKYKLICFGGGAFSSDELKSINGMGLNKDQVIQLSGDDQLLSKLYRSATAFIFPSLYEGFGIPPLEAMSNNCPVVCSNTSSIPEVVGDAGEYFDPTNIDSIRSAIEKVISSSSYKDSLVAKGRERLKCFSWDKCAVETLDVYKRLA